MTQQVVNTEMPYVPDVTGAGYGVMAALCQDDAGKYAVYVGVVPNNYVNDDQYTADKRKHANMVMSRGHKIPHREALRYFPALPANEYRD